MSIFPNGVVPMYFAPFHFGLWLNIVFVFNVVLGWANFWETIWQVIHGGSQTFACMSFIHNTSSKSLNFRNSLFPLHLVSTWCIYLRLPSSLVNFQLSSWIVRNISKCCTNYVSLSITSTSGCLFLQGTMLDAFVTKFITLDRTICQVLNCLMAWFLISLYSYKDSFLL